MNLFTFADNIKLRRTYFVIESKGWNWEIVKDDKNCIWKRWQIV